MKYYLKQIFFLSSEVINELKMDLKKKGKSKRIS